MAKIDDLDNQHNQHTSQENVQDDTYQMPDRDQRRAEWPDYRKWRRSDFGAARVFWAAILIGAGGLFLINDFGHTPTYVWDNLARLWPLLLVFVGLRMLVGRGRVAAWITTAVAILVIIGFLAYAAGATFPEVAHYFHQTVPLIPHKF